MNGLGVVACGFGNAMASDSAKANKHGILLRKKG